MIIMKKHYPLIFHTNHTHTDDFPSTGTRLVHINTKTEEPTDTHIQCTRILDSNTGRLTGKLTITMYTTVTV